MEIKFGKMPVKFSKEDHVEDLTEEKEKKELKLSPFLEEILKEGEEKGLREKISKFKEKIIKNAENNNLDLSERLEGLRELIELKDAEGSNSEKIEYEKLKKMQGVIDLIDRSWEEKELEKVIDLALEAQKDDENKISENNLEKIFERVLVVRKKNGYEKEINTVSDLTAKCIEKKIEKEIKFNKEQEESVIRWLKYIDFVHPDLVIKLYQSFFNNREKVSDGFLVEAVNEIINNKKLLPGLKLSEFFKDSHNNIAADIFIIDELKEIKVRGNVYGWTENEEVRISDSNMEVKVGFVEEYGEEIAEELLKKLKENNKSYFIKKEIEVALSPILIDFPTDKKRGELKNNWEDVRSYYFEVIEGDAGAKESHWPKEMSFLSEAILDKEKISDELVDNFFENYKRMFVSRCQELEFQEWEERYGRKETKNKTEIENNIDKDYSVVYDYKGNPLYFIDRKKGNEEKISLDELLSKEGVNLKNKKGEELKIIFESLIKLPIRDLIEGEFNIKLSDLNIREQIQFVGFLADKDREEIEKIKKFINEGENEKDKENRFRLFFALEENGLDYGNNLIELGNNLAEEKQTADILFREYVRAVNNAKNKAEVMAEEYNELFFSKKISYELIKKAFIQQDNGLLKEAEGIIKAEKTNEEKREAIFEAINGIRDKKEARERMFRELKYSVEELNTKYKEISEAGFELIFDNPEQATKSREENKDFFEQYLKTAPDIEKEFFKKEEEKNKKYDSERLKMMINLYERMYKQTPQVEEVVKKRMNNEQRQNLERELEREQKKFEPLVKKLKELLIYQNNLEKKLEQIIFGRESVKLPKEIVGNLKEEVKEFKKEELPRKEFVYFPVGISKDQASWEKVFEGELKTAKPIEIYSYLFWLNNQERKVKIVVCDQIQAESNYKNLYNLDEEEAVVAAKKIGKEEQKNYKKIIEEFNLSNLEVVEYEDFLERIGKEKFKEYKDFLSRLVKDKDWQGAFLSAIQESIGEQKTKEEKEKYLPYVIEEIAWILAANGTKISHPNEARYDAIAALIKNMESEFNKIGKNKENILTEKERENEIKAILLQKFTDIINERKAKIGKGVIYDYYDKLRQQIARVRVEKINKPRKKEKSRFFEFNFYVPNLGSQSFGFRSAGEKQEEIMNFKEPYSTYFYKEEAGVFINSDQVVASPEGIISGKIAVLGEYQQEKYAREVIKPLLINYFKIIEKAPKKYWEKIGRNREELMKECQECLTLPDLNKFIQKYIVKPVFE